MRAAMIADHTSEVVIIGGGLAGLSAAIYLGRSLRQTILVESGRSMARWEPEVQNYLGFPDGISGSELLDRGRRQAEAFGVPLIRDDVQTLGLGPGGFDVQGNRGRYHAQRVLLATGLTHLPPEIPGVKQCLGKSLFFCKDCDAYRLQGKRIAIIGANNEAADYALGMRAFSASVLLATNGKPAGWDPRRQQWIDEYELPIRYDPLRCIEHEEGRIRLLNFQEGPDVPVDAAFTTRGDVYHTDLAKQIGAELDATGQLVVDADMRTSVAGLYAAGCMTPANCQMVIAAGQGATAAQAINRDLFMTSLREHRLPVWRERAPRRSGSTMVGQDTLS